MAAALLPGGFSPVSMIFRITLLICASVALSGCLYHIDIQQGNFIDKETLAKLKPGMTRAQVKFLLGTPLIADPFSPDRWDYLYYTRPGTRIKDVRRLTLYFDGDHLQRALADASVDPLIPDKKPPPKTEKKPAPETTAAAQGVGGQPSPGR